MAKAKKLPSGQWRTLVYSHTDAEGKRKYESFTADTKKESEFMAADFALKKTVSDNCITIKEMLEKYIPAKKDVLSPTTLRGYKSLFRTHYASIFDIKVNNITNDIIQSWVGSISIKSSPKTVRNAHALLSSSLDMFLPEFRLKTTLPQKKKPELYIPNDQDIKNLIDYVSGKELELAIYLAAFGPMRLGEICALESNDI